MAESKGGVTRRELLRNALTGGAGVVTGAVLTKVVGESGVGSTEGSSKQEVLNPNLGRKLRFDHAPVFNFGEAENCTFLDELDERNYNYFFAIQPRKAREAIIPQSGELFSRENNPVHTNEQFAVFTTPKVDPSSMEVIDYTALSAEIAALPVFGELYYVQNSDGYPQIGDRYVVSDGEKRFASGAWWAFVNRDGKYVNPSTLQPTDEPFYTTGQFFRPRSG